MRTTCKDRKHEKCLIDVYYVKHASSEDSADKMLIVLMCSLFVIVFFIGCIVVLQSQLSSTFQLHY